MRAVIGSCGLSAVLVLALAGCNGTDTFFTQHRTLGKKSDVILTDAGARTVVATQVQDSDSVGHFEPNQINCAEPSPDVAKAIDTAFSGGISLNITGEGANLPVEAQAKIAAAITQARAEALVQMTERLPTIQLLRDGLFRACEAYANGALSPTSYALMLSRYGDTMVTMLSSDLIAGNFGRELAAISGSASGAASASLDDAGQSAEMSQRDLQEAAEEVTEKTAEVNEAIEEVQKEAAAAGTPQTAPTPITPGTLGGVVTDPAAPAEPAEPGTVTEGIAPAPGTSGGGDTPGETPAQADLNEKLEELKKASESYQTKLATATQGAAAAKATAARGFAAQDMANERAGLIADMQRLYMQQPSPGALMVACITALDREPGSKASPFSVICQGLPGIEGLLSETAKVVRSQVTAQLPAHEADSAISSVQADVERALKAHEVIQMLNRATAKPGELPATTPATPRSVSDTVTQVQTVLKQLGFYAGTADGYAGPATTMAVKRFQTANALPVTGLLDSTTVERILAAKQPG